jgi:hypothetical protein
MSCPVPRTSFFFVGGGAGFFLEGTTSLASTLGSALGSALAFDSTLVLKKEGAEALEGPTWGEALLPLDLAHGETALTDSMPPLTSAGAFGLYRSDRSVSGQWLLLEEIE